LVSCTADLGPEPASDYQEDSGQDLLASGKADGMLDYAPVFEMNAEQDGNLQLEQIDVYALHLRGGDQIRVVMSAGRGESLQPQASLFSPNDRYIRSDRWNVEGATVMKEFSIYADGRYSLIASAYRGRGYGDYTLSIECLGGPCANPVESTPLDYLQAADCFKQARECVTALINPDSPFSTDEADQVWGDCLGAQSTDGVACDTACDGAETVGYCAFIVSELEWLSEETQACRTLHTECVSDCYQASEHAPEAPEGFGDTAESVCVVAGPLNGDCRQFARNHTSCGGSDYEVQSYGECHAECKSTHGAWIDDLNSDCDDICSDYEFQGEQCDQACQVIDECDSEEWWQIAGSDCFSSCTGMSDTHSAECISENECSEVSLCF